MKRTMLGWSIILSNVSKSNIEIERLYYAPHQSSFMEKFLKSSDCGIRFGARSDLRELFEFFNGHCLVSHLCFENRTKSTLG